MEVLNKRDICEGKITRKNTKNPNEFSAIDFVVASPTITALVQKMYIDEDGLYKIKGKQETDHNTICIEINANNIDKDKVIKKTDWNLRASSEKWALFGDELSKRCEYATAILRETSKPFQLRYANWFKEVKSHSRRAAKKSFRKR